MTTHDQAAGGSGEPTGRSRRRSTRSRPPETCDHPHARLVEVDGTGEQVTVLVCEECGSALDARDATLRRTQRLSEPRFCVDCGVTHWTTGTRRSV